MFSIIIPSYNRNAYIADLLKSLELQTVHNFEVIIVDDYSSEAVTLTKNYSFPVNIIRNENNEGAAESRNIGARKAKNDWLLFLDDDDRFFSGKCEIITQVITQHPEINFIYHPAECVMVNEDFTYVTAPFKNENDITLDNMLRANKIGGMPMIGIKKTLFLAAGGLSSELLSLEDYEFLLKVILQPDFKAKYIDQALTQCTFHTQRASVSTSTKNTEAAVRQIAEKYVRTEQQETNFSFNAAYMLAYPHIMNLSRQASRYYLKLFQLSLSPKYLIIALITLISPKLAINMKRFV